MATDYSYLLAEYPEKISQDQLYRICRISKRKATWLLENGYILRGYRQKDPQV